MNKHDEIKPDLSIREILGIAIFITVVVVLAAVFVGGTASAATPTHSMTVTKTTGDPDADKRPCVTNREMYGVKYMDRKALEKRWEVKGLGFPGTGTIGKGWFYPRCDREPGTPGYYVQVQWDWTEPALYLGWAIDPL